MCIRDSGRHLHDVVQRAAHRDLRILQAVAGALRDIRRGKIRDGSTVVCTLTGHGLKDPEIAMRGALDHIVKVPAERGAIADLLAKKMA